MAEIEAGNAIEAGLDEGDAGGGSGGGGATRENFVQQSARTNNIVWARMVPAGAVVTLPFTYAVESPAEMAVSVY